MSLPKDVHYLSSFDDEGHRTASVVSGVHFTDEDGMNKYLDDGFRIISDEQYNRLLGNLNEDDYADQMKYWRFRTGWVLDFETGEVVPDKPSIRTVASRMDARFSEFNAAMEEVNKQIVVATTTGDDQEVIDALKAERDELTAAYQADIEALSKEEDCFLIFPSKEADQPELIPVSEGY